MTSLFPYETVKSERAKSAGKSSLDKKRFYAETAQVLAERLGCKMVVFPGHHGSFVDMPNEWDKTLGTICIKG